MSMSGGDNLSQTEVKKNFKGEDVTVIGPSYEAGKPAGEEAGRWAHRLESREQIMSFLTNGERYFYGDDWFGSERRKNPA